MKSLKLDCECHAEILDVEYWEEEKQFCFVVFRYAPLRFSWKRRLQFLFSGTIDYNEIFLSHENASKLACFLNNNIKQ